MHANLLVETADPSSFEYTIEESSSRGSTNVYVTGPYCMCGQENKNGRIYDIDEMREEVSRYNKTMIESKRALGELNHPTTAEVDLERACHLVVSLESCKDDPNVYIGKSKILSTPTGTIVQSLIKDGVSVGMSTRSLGKLLQVEGSSANRVKDMRLVAIDCVADPSFGEAFVNGILESKQYILDNYGQYVEAYENFERGISNIPKKDVEQYIKNNIIDFISALKGV